MNKLKLAELRSKTDRQFVALISNRLDAALHFEGDAESICDEVSALLPCLSGEKRRRLEATLSQLRNRLDDSAPVSEMRVETACS